MNERIYNGGIDRLRSPERVERLEIDKVVNLCLLGSKIKTLLDIGTGSGLFAEAFSRSKITVAGIDINNDMIESAKIHLPNSTFFVAPSENIPSDANSFDATFFGLVFHEVTDYKKSLEEAFRISRFYTYILEWQYKTEDFGPPIEHRLKQEFIEELGLSVGYKKFTGILLNSLVLYKLEKQINLFF